MAKWYKVLPKGFVCLVAVLMVLSALAVPSRDARSDEPISESECEDDTACPEGYVCVDGICVQSTCKNGNPECDVYQTETDCEPGFNNKCDNSNPRCGCRWGPGTGGEKCWCNTIN